MVASKKTKLARTSKKGGKKIVAKKPVKKTVKRKLVVKKSVKKVLTLRKTKGKKKKVVKKITKKVIKKKVVKKPAIKVKKKIVKLRRLKKKVGVKLKRSVRNPVMAPSTYHWESHAVFNPAAVISGGRVHLFYRALGPDGVSRIGYASSKDGIHFDVRMTYPVYVAESFQEAQKHWPYTSPARLVYDPTLYQSGGGWGGCEDPRAVVIDGTVFMTFNMFNGWHSMRVGVTSIKESDLLNKKWLWNNFAFLSRPGDRQKNWVLFPEKINGKFALFHNLDLGDPKRVYISYMNELSMDEAPQVGQALDPQLIPDHIVAWHKRTRSASAPPIKTKDGWLLLYHAMDKNDGGRYKVGALLLDLKDPQKVLYRAPAPILEPDMWYENDYKPGIVYASGAVVKDGKLLVYYGGGDKYIGVASIKLNELLEHLKQNKAVHLKKEQTINPNS